ncbi:MAG: phosphatase PAP2 family protein [Clostridiaceae bacterium]
MKKIKEYVKHAWIFMIYLLISSLYPVFNRPWNRVRDLATGIDRSIPFLKIFVIPYWSWYVFIVAGTVFLLIKDKRSYFMAVYSLCIGTAVSYIIYMFFQTTIVRPEVAGNDFLSELLRYTYNNDKPYNCFPSLHVYTTLVLGYYIYKLENIRSFQRGVTVVLAAAIILSTLFIKQHLVADVFGSFGLCYFIVTSINILEEKIWTSESEKRSSGVMEKL